MSRVAIGFRAHSGWTALVALCLEKGEPVVLRRERLPLVAEFTYKFRQPYHTAEKMPREKGRSFITQVSAEARRLSYRGLRGLQADLADEGHSLSACGLLLASSRPLPGLDSILASHALIHTADGELFREALAHASTKCGLAPLKIKEKELLVRATQTLRLSEPALLRCLTELGRPVGSPWSQDEKYAALVAWMSLCNSANARTNVEQKKLA
jgi:hypothetical protein